MPEFFIGFPASGLLISAAIFASLTADLRSPLMVVGTAPFNISPAVVGTVFYVSIPIYNNPVPIFVFGQKPIQKMIRVKVIGIEFDSCD